MGLKEYTFRGSVWQFEEGEQPSSAVPVESLTAQPAEEFKARTPLNKARRPVNKADGGSR